MKLGVISALSIAVAWALVAIAQLWAKPLSADHFVKLSITAAILVVVIMVVTLVVRELMTEKKLKDDGYIDS